MDKANEIRRYRMTTVSGRGRIPSPIFMVKSFENMTNSLPGRDQQTPASKLSREKTNTIAIQSSVLCSNCCE